MADEELSAATAAVTIQGPPESIGRFPAELQNMIFAGLGAEAYQFSYDPVSAGSALEALWRHLRAPKVIDTDDVEEFQDKALDHMAEPERLLTLLDYRPEDDLASKLHELALAIPCTRITGQVGVMELLIPTAELPVAWDLKTMGKLFAQLTSLQKLSLFGLWIPRDRDDRIPHELHPYFKIIPIPPSVRSLYIEEGWSGDRADDSAKDGMSREQIEHADLTFIIEDFRDYENITYLEYKLPILMDHCFDHLRKFTALKTFKLNQDTTALLDDLTFEDMMVQLKHAGQVETIELWYPKMIRANSPFHGRWNRALPQLRTIRLNFQCFVEAFEGTEPKDDLHFQLLIDTNLVPHIGLINDEVKTLTEDRTPVPEEGLHDTMEGRVHNVIDRIYKVQEIFETKRSEGKVENRSVSLVHYDWPEEHEDLIWFQGGYGMGEDEFDDDLERWANEVQT